MEQKQYKLKESAHGFKEEDAQIIGNFLDQKFPEGQYTTKAVVDSARSPNSPIHHYFEWDDSIAAEGFREVQARKMIQCVVVVIDGTELPKSVNVFIEGTDQRTYMNTELAQTKTDVWEQVLSDALAGLRAWKNRFERFKQLKELKPVLEAITQLEHDYGSKKDGKKARRRATKRSSNSTHQSRTRKSDDSRGVSASRQQV